MIEYDRQKLGNFLRESRERAGLTQANVAERLGYTSAQFMSNIERGVSVAPISTLGRMARLYKENPDSIVEIIIQSQQELMLKKLIQKTKRAKVK